MLTKKLTLQNIILISFNGADSIEVTVLVIIIV